MKKIKDSKNSQYLTMKNGVKDTIALNFKSAFQKKKV